MNSLHYGQDMYINRYKYEYTIRDNTVVKNVQCKLESGWEYVQIGSIHINEKPQSGWGFVGIGPFYHPLWHI